MLIGEKQCILVTRTVLCLVAVARHQATTREKSETGRRTNLTFESGNATLNLGLFAQATLKDPKKQWMKTIG